jgi:hypothetical protein
MPNDPERHLPGRLGRAGAGGAVGLAIGVGVGTAIGVAVGLGIGVAVGTGFGVAIGTALSRWKRRKSDS